MAPPRSSTIGLAPARAKTMAAKMPAGPKPTTTGLVAKDVLFVEFFLVFYCDFDLVENSYIVAGIHRSADNTE
jgi:hypothetical protein